jgi:hypothetical protein
MNVVKRVAKKEFELEIEDKQTEGYKVVSKSDSTCILEKRNLGKPIWHILIFIVTVWFTLGAGNLFYLLYAYLVNVDKIEIKIK